MQTITATEAAEAAININRVDWIHGAAELVLANDVQYDRSTRRGKEAFISLDNVMEDVMGLDATKRIIQKWLLGDECCDKRDELNLLVKGCVMIALMQMADDFNIGLE